MAELEHAKFNDAALRHLTVVKKKAETSPSSMMKTVEREEARKAQCRRSTPLPDASRQASVNQVILTARIEEASALRIHARRHPGAGSETRARVLTPGGRRKPPSHVDRNEP